MIRAEKITKFYPTNSGRHYVFRNASVEIPAGAQVGVFGRNGSGKSTLMRMLAGVDVPDRGRIVKWGTISWPLGIANCVQSQMTGRENTRFACRIQGLYYDEMEPIIDFVQSFAEIGSFFDMPVRTYSSGMRSRLSFGITLAFDFDFYIIDEVTAVGDRAFKDKAKAMFETKRRKAGFIRTSHTTSELRAECSSGLVLHDAKIEYFPAIEDAIERYSMLTGIKEEGPAGRKSAVKPPKKPKPAREAKPQTADRDRSQRSRMSAQRARSGQAGPGTGARQ